MSILDVHVPDWMEHSLCAQVGTELFFPEKGFSSIPARRVCGECPVTLKCLEWAIDLEADAGSMPGIYGGLSANQRAEIRRKRAAA